MSKRLPKATLSTLNDIHRETRGEIIDSTAERVDEESANPAPVPALRPTENELRRLQAGNIVERYTTYSALGGCIPLAIFDGLSVSLIIFNMVQALAEHYRVPFQQDKLKASIAALTVGVASPSISGIAAQLIGRIIPGAWLINTAISSAAAAALTRYTGQSFIEHFESGGTALDFDTDKLRGYFRRKAAI